MFAVPLSLTPLIGRSHELAALCALLDSNRLLTLTGAGGSGKTRLAAEIARRCVDNFADGVLWIELAPLGDPELLPTYLLDVLGLEPGARPPMTALVDSLREREALMVLDNCEHLVEACAAFVSILLRGCPHVRILATSREALGVHGERAWLVPGLACPPSDAAPVAEIGESSAVKLFVERAEGALASFQLTPANAGAVAHICRRLDGLPLAIELAAARVRTLPPEELATRLDDALRVLGAGARTAVSRHRTLRETVEWSYRLLDEREKTLLQRLSMFAGDFTLNAAESVGADVDLDAADVLDIIGALVDKSLIVMRESEGSARFYLLETIRQYAALRLEESGTFHRVCSRHARTYADLVAEAAPHFITSERPPWVQRVHRELDNIRVALAWTRESDIAAHLKLCGDLGWFWYSSGLWAEGRRWQEGAIALPGTDDMRHARAAVLLGGAVLASLQGQPPVALPWLEESVALFRSAGDRSGEAYALAYQGVSLGQTGDARAVEPCMRALEWFRAAGDLYGARLCLVVLSTDYGAIGEPERARETGEEGVAVARAYGLDRELAIALQVLASARLVLGDVSGAGQLLRESILSLQRDPSLFWSARAVQLFAVVEFRRGEYARGARLMGAGDTVRGIIGASTLGPDRIHLEPQLAAARAALGDAAFDAAWQGGRSLTISQVFDEIVCSEAAPAGAVSASPTPVVTVAGEPALDVRTLGSLQILRDGVPLSPNVWRYARPRELLLYLLAHPDGRTREQIGLVFWPDASATQVKNNFHVMLHHVRKAIGRADLIAFEDDKYRIAWELGVRFDAREFEDSVRAGLSALRAARSEDDATAAAQRIGDALELYRGDFLADADAGDWHLDVRDRLRRLCVDAAVALGERHLKRNEFKEAVDSFRRALAGDELHEATHRRLMLALSRAGERSEAMRQYARLARVLRTDLGAEPERETLALYEQLRTTGSI
jgi:predicted ATPase/DNA-binding SARP family transcriptional activator